METIHESSDAECCFCGQLGLDSDVSLNKHLKNHTRFKTESPLKLRKRARDSEAIGSCRICLKELTRISVLKHMEVKHERPSGCCPLCGFGDEAEVLNDLGLIVETGSVRSESDALITLTKHMKTKHDSFKPYACEKCGKRFNLSTQAKRHCEPKTEDDFLPLQCSHCGKRFNNSSSLQTHINRRHLGVGYNRKKSVCTICRRTFQGPSRLRGHLISHHFPDQKEHKCVVCCKLFTEKRLMKEHMPIHEGKFNFECKTCHKKFGRRKYLTQHEKKHLPPKWECLCCTKQFVWKHGLTTHLTQVHKIAEYEKYSKHIEDSETIVLSIE
jgi:uncharacterized Zn-finger protein